MLAADDEETRILLFLPAIFAVLLQLVASALLLAHRLVVAGAPRPGVLQP